MPIVGAGDRGTKCAVTGDVTRRRSSLSVKPGNQRRRSYPACALQCVLSRARDAADNRVLSLFTSNCTTVKSRIDNERERERERERVGAVPTESWGCDLCL
jgi:hypothetical protein